MSQSDTILQSGLKQGPEVLNLQFDRAFDKLATWLQSQILPRNLPTVLSICSGLRIGTPPSNWESLPHKILRDIIRSSKDPWRIICRLFPSEVTRKVPIVMVNVYLKKAPRYDIS